jgi:hypothetical protein
MPRYLGVLFLSYIVFALLAAKSRFWNELITVFSLLFVSLFSVMFVNGYCLTWNCRH